jgi:Zn-finger nucleic acid-binding protein
MNCPKCGEELRAIRCSIAGHQSSDQSGFFRADQCFSCNGFWFEGEALKRYLDMDLTMFNSPAIDQSRAGVLDKKVGACPQCGIEMVRESAEHTPNVMIDRCTACSGVWLDSTEIDQLENPKVAVEAIIPEILKKLSEYFGR